MALPSRPLHRQLRRTAHGNPFSQADSCDHALGSCRRRAASAVRRARSEVDDDGVSSSSNSSSSPTTTSTRRQTLLLAAAATTPLALSLPIFTPSALASSVPALDGVWFSLTGAPPDLFFPAASFLGEFDAVSTLVSAEAPLGEAVLPPASLAGLRRAREEDLEKPLRYRTRFVPAPAGNPATPPDACVFDRAFNTLSLLRATSPGSARGARVEWDVADPNLLTLKFDAVSEEEAEETGEEKGEGGGAGRSRAAAAAALRRRGAVRVRVTKRSERAVAADRLDTSEFVQTIFLNDGESENGGGVPRVKASQVFSKWRWRAEGESEGPTVVATQVVSEFLSVEAGGERAYLESAGRPVAVYTYRLALTRV